jgi:excisionase family DNA binding protein
MTKQKKGFLSVEQAASKLGISERSVYRFIKAKQLKATKLGAWRITSNDLQAFIKRRSNIK